MIHRSILTSIAAGVLILGTAYADDLLGGKGKGNGGGQSNSGGSQNGGGNRERGNGGGQSSGGSQNSGGGLGSSKGDRGNGNGQSSGGSSNSGGSSTGNRDRGNGQSNGGGLGNSGGGSSNGGGYGKGNGGGQSSGGSSNSGGNSTGNRDRGNGQSSGGGLGNSGGGGAWGKGNGNSTGSGSGSSSSGGSSTNRGGGSSSSGGSSNSGGYSTNRDRDRDRNSGGSSQNSNSGGGLFGGKSDRGGATYGGGGNSSNNGRGNNGSLSGRVNYGTNNNRSGNSNSNNFRISDIPRTGRIGQDVLRNDQTKRNFGYRDGYYRQNDWRDDYFFYPHYQFSYDYNRCVPSPWYFYPTMPAYLSIGRVTIVTDILSLFRNCNDVYNWSPNRSRYDYDRYSNYDRDLDYAIEDIQDAFERNSIRPLSGLIINNSSILIELEGQACYRLRGDDFYDLMQDLIESNDTISYRILDVRRGRDDSVVRAMHEVRDSWGGRVTTYHTFRIHEERGRYSIQEFSVSRNR